LEPLESKNAGDQRAGGVSGFFFEDFGLLVPRLVEGGAVEAIVLVSPTCHRLCEGRGPENVSGNVHFPAADATHGGTNGTWIAVLDSY